MSQVPDRCHTCVHWLGHLSNNPFDRRCNRNYGHDTRWGDFWDESFAGQPYGDPVFVEAACRVPQWGLPLPFMDENGLVLSPDPPPVQLVDAYIPRLRAVGESLPIRLQTRYGTLALHADQLREYLMATDKKKEELAKLFAGRDAQRARLQKDHQRVYKGLYGTTPKVLHGSQELPPYRRGLEVVPTGLAPLDAALKGGIPVGCRVLVSGKPDSGKSTLVNALEGAFIRYYREKVAEFHREMGFSEKEIDAAVRNERIGLIKPESFEINYMIRAMNLGPDAQELFDQHCEFVATEFSEESKQYVISVLQAANTDLEEYRGPETYSYMLPIPYRFFTLDSVDAEQMAAESFGAGMKEKVMGETAQIAAQARVLAEFFRKSYKAAMIPITLLMVSQERTGNIQTRAKTTVHRGKAMPYFTTLEIILWAEKQKDSDVTIPVHVKFGKVHVDANVRKDDEIILHLRPGRGFDPLDNAIPAALEQNILVTSGAWVKYTALDGTEYKNQGTNPGKIADWLGSIGLAEEVQQRTYEALLVQGTPRTGVSEDGEVEYELDDDAAEQPEVSED